MGMDRIDPLRLKEAVKLFGDFLQNEKSGGRLPSPDEVKKMFREGAFAALTAGALFGATLTTAEANEPRALTRIEQLRQKVFSEHEIDFLAQNVYHESRGESPRGQLAVLQVTIARLVSGKFDRGNGLIDGIIFAPNQFSWTTDPKILMSKMDTQKLADIRNMVELFVGGKQAEDIVHALMKQTGLPKETHYYKKTDWKSDFFDSLKKITEIDKHSFYVEPQRSARAEKRN